MNQNEEEDKLFNQYLALDQLGAIFDRIQRYQKILSMKIEEHLTCNEKFWLLAYNGLNLEFSLGTEESLLKAGQLSVIVESFIPEEFK